MARYRYTLKTYDPNSNQEIIVKLKEQDGYKEKVYLTTIDKFILSHYVKNHKYENFNHREELIEYLNDYYNYQIPLSSNIYISYQADKMEKTLELVWKENLVLQYFSHLYTYFYQNDILAEDVKLKIKNNRVWQIYWNEFQKNISNEQYYRFLINGVGKNYVNSYLKKWLKQYHDNCYYETFDEQELFFEAKDKIEQQLQYYKVLRGIELSYKKYHQIYNRVLGIDDKKMKCYLEKQQLTMPLNEPIYYGKNEELQVETLKTGYDDLDEILGIPATNISELSEQVFEELGLSLEELENYPELKEKLGMIDFHMEESFTLQKRKS